MSWEAITGVLAVGVSLIIGVLTYMRSRKVDASAEKAGVVVGFEALVNNLQEDNKAVRDEIRRGVAEAEARCEQRIVDAVAELKRELTRRPTRDELLDANGKLKKQLLDQGITPLNGISP